MSVEKQITEALIGTGIDLTDIDFRGSGYFRYGYWRRLPSEAYEAIAHLVDEDLYEDDDGDDERGRPIIIKRWSYHFNPQTPTL